MESQCFTPCDVTRCLVVISGANSLASSELALAGLKHRTRTRLTRFLFESNKGFGGGRVLALFAELANAAAALVSCHPTKKEHLM